MISPREKDHEYDVDHRGDLFYIRTNKGCRNFRVVTAPVADPGQANWKELLPYRAGVMARGLDLFAGHAVVLEREDGLPRIRVIDLATERAAPGGLPRAGLRGRSAEQRGVRHAVFRFRYQSFTTPPSVFDYDMATRSASS